MMSFLAALALCAALLLAAAVYWIVRAVRERNWKRAIILTALALCVLAALYFGLLFLITAM